MVHMRLHQSLAFILASCLLVSGLPRFGQRSDTVLAKARATFAQVVERLDEEATKWKSIADAKAEIDRLVVHRYLFDGLSSEHLILLEKYVFGKCPADHFPFNVRTGKTSGVARACIHRDHLEHVLNLENLKERRTDQEGVTAELNRMRRKRSEAFVPLTETTNFAHVSRPSTDITSELLHQLLAVQPPDTATVGSVMPAFQNGTIDYGVQLDGEVAATMTLKASTDLPCGIIGTDPEPELELRPKGVDNGTTHVYIPDCSIIAVNMYNSTGINYWVQDQKGSLYSLAGSNKLVGLKDLNANAGVALVLRAKPAGKEKRGVSMHECNMAGQGIAKRARDKRGFSTPDLHTSTMSEEACAGIACNNNGGHSAVYHPFTKTCVCRDPVYLETDHSA